MDSFLNKLPIPQDVLIVLLYVCLTILAAIIVDNLFRAFVKNPKKIVNRQARTYAEIAHKTITVIVYSIAVYFIFKEIGIDITPVLASAGIIGIVIGIGARALIEDFINGFFLLTQDAVAAGDYVKIDDTEGTVESLGFRSLTLRGDGGEMFTIPNGMVKKVINYSRHRSSVFIDFPIKSDQEIEPVIKSMENALSELKEEKTYKDFIYEGSKYLGITDFKVDGKYFVRSKIITISSMRFEVPRRYRYLVKKNFEKNKVVLV